jgi:hypothetical protein
MGGGTDGLRRLAGKRRENRKTFPGKVRGTADPLGCARDDKKERVVVRRRRLLKERTVAKGDGTHGGISLPVVVPRACYFLDFAL